MTNQTTYHPPESPVFRRVFIATAASLLLLTAFMVEKFFPRDFKDAEV